jgi:hypothetical protein
MDLNVTLNIESHLIKKIHYLQLGSREIGLLLY